MKKKFVIANFIMFLLILSLDICYMIKGGLFIKGITSSMFVITGIINIIYCVNNNVNLEYPKRMILALICTMIADVLLGINFYLGTVTFAIGHILYFRSYSKLVKINRGDFKVGIIISVISLLIILFIPFLNFESILMKGVCSTYAIIISFMIGKTISNLIKENNITNKVIAIGSLLFFISDLMLMLDVFGGISVTGYLCLATYYPAQFILAFSIFAYANENLLQEMEVSLNYDCTYR
ncbi:MAG: lysoplasmalogenase [Peptostreptococcaceae bacterium]|nr:lysoplasmalogenase [Peptostreptococcaceae bacterium]